MPAAQVKISPTSQFYKEPAKAHREDAGFDLYSAVTVVIPPGVTTAVSLGFCMEIPIGFEAQIRARSGNALNGLVVANSPGTIDAGYRGEVKVILHNQSKDDWWVETGDRIAQMVIQPVQWVNLQTVSDELSDSLRGVAGLGSTGK